MRLGLIEDLAAYENGHEATASVEVLSCRGEELVVRIGGTVVKAHDAHADPVALRSRVAVAADPRLTHVLVAPLPSRERMPVRGEGSRLVARVGGRWVTRWPAGRPLTPHDGDTVPWAQAARLLANLHETVPLGQLPVAGGPSRVSRALRLLRSCRNREKTISEPLLTQAIDTIRQATTTLPTWVWGWELPPLGRRVGLCHGDWHLGQMVDVGHNEWRLIDIDDLGIGDLTWDLARPAAWFAAGLLPRRAWETFLRAYLDAGGKALSTAHNPWPALDIPARAIVVQSAALAVVNSIGHGGWLDDVGMTLLDCCERMVRAKQGCSRSLQW